ncbi:MAG: S1C family serine protease [Terriglobales bacterium]
MKLLALLLLLPVALCGQAATSVLVRAALVNNRLDQKPVPLLTLRFTSAAGGPPRSIATSFSGRARLHLPAGRYSLTTPHPVIFDGVSYRWKLTVAIAGAAQEIDLSNANAERTVLPAVPPHPRASPSSRATLASQYRRLHTSVVTVWSDLGRGSGFLVDPRGLVVTNDHVIAGADYLAVQFDAQHKVHAVLLAADADRDIAVLRVNMKADPAATVAPLATPQELAAVAPGDRVFTLGRPLNQRKLLTSGMIGSVRETAFLSAININHGSSGGPLFDDAGHVIGITTFLDAGTPNGPGVSGILKISQAWPVLQRARAAMAADAAPAAALLPVVPSPPYPIDALKSVTGVEKFDLKPYQFHEGGFNVLVTTPVLATWLATHSQRDIARRRSRHRRRSADEGAFNPAADMHAWMRYTGDYTPTVEVIATPKIGATKWSAFGHIVRPRLIAEHMHFKADFDYMELYCHGKLVPPILPGKVTQALDFAYEAMQGRDAAFEGLYEYGPGAFNPACGAMTLKLYSSTGAAVKTKRLDPKLVRRIWASFAPWREARNALGLAS